MKTQVKRAILRGLVITEALISTPRGSGLLTSFLIFLACVSLYAQEPVTKGSWNAFRGDFANKIADTMTTDRTTFMKADYDAAGLVATNIDTLDVWVVGPVYYYGNSVPQSWYNISFFDKIAVTHITSSSCKVHIWIQNYDIVWVQFRVEGTEEWQSGGHWEEPKGGQTKVLHKVGLQPGVRYEYQVIIDDSFSPILIFNTL